MPTTTRRGKRLSATSRPGHGSREGECISDRFGTRGLTTFSPIRGDKLSFDPDCYCGEGVPADKNGMCTGPKALQNRLGEWNEWYVDIHNKKCKKHIKKVMKRRILQAAKKGCDGVDPDNVDEVSKSREKSDGC